MLSFAALCRDLFLLAQDDLPSQGATRGRAWEHRIAEHLTRRGVPVEAVPGGCRILGHASLSGLAHQIDGSFACADAFVIGEWKAYRGAIPKNEVLRFKAATDDYYAAMARSLPQRPIMRVFGGIGRASRDLRCYAALHGIAVIDPEHWPAAVLAAESLRWPDRTDPVPTSDEQHELAWLCRPLQQVLQPRPDGSLVIPPAATPSRLATVIDLHDHWSARLWDAVDANVEWFEALRARTGTCAA